MFRQGKLRQRNAAAITFALLLAEGHAVGAGIHSGVSLVGTHQDPLQRAVVSILAVVCTLRNGALNALVCVTVHIQFLLPFSFGISMAQQAKTIQANFSYIFVFLQRRIDFFTGGLYNEFGVCKAPNLI